VFNWFKKQFPSPRQVEERLEDVESKMRRLQLEAQDLFERTERAMFRALKRGGRAAAEQLPPEPLDDDPRYRHLDPVSRRIVAQRARSLPPKNGAT